MKLADLQQRRRVLTDFDTTLLVEAAAGTGKTSLIAGRVAMLLANGAAPAEIAAITFTELAAGELSLRIRGYVAALLAGKPPDVLKSALPEGLDEQQKSNLAAASEHLDEVSASTIHGFCQEIIRSYAIETGLDPDLASWMPRVPTPCSRQCCRHGFRTAFPAEPAPTIPSSCCPGTIRSRSSD